MKRQQGFTVFELIVAIIVLIVAGTFFYIQKRDVDIANRDSARKTAINTIYYNLEDVYYATFKAYPEYITSDQLKGIDPNTLKDPNDKAFGTDGSDYSYVAKDCSQNLCRSYTLTANLENEADYTKNSRNQ